MAMPRLSHLKVHSGYFLRLRSQMRDWVEICLGETSEDMVAGCFHKKAGLLVSVSYVLNDWANQARLCLQR